MAKHKVLSTKKLEPSLIEKARENDIEIMEQEFISIQAIDSKEKFDEILSHANPKERTTDYVVFTSTNAVKIVNDNLSIWNRFRNYSINFQIFCLSGLTYNTIIRSPSFVKDIIVTADNSSDLAKKIIEHEVKEIIFFCGNKRRDELPAILKEAGIKVHEVIVYETVETPAIVTDDFDGVLFFSPSAVQSFFSVNQLKKGTVCFAIGETTADSIADFTDNKIIISESPGQEMMLASVRFYFENSNY